MEGLASLLAMPKIHTPTNEHQFAGDLNDARRMAEDAYRKQGTAGRYNENNMIYDAQGNKVQPGLFEKLLKMLPQQSHPAEGRPKMGDFMK